MQSCNKESNLLCIMWFVQGVVCKKLIQPKEANLYHHLAVIQFGL